MGDMDIKRDPGECRESLRNLAEGRLGDWHGLPDQCQRADAEAALGPSAEGMDGVGNLGGQMTAFREYPGTDIAPFGLLVWYEGDDILVVQINQPNLGEDPEQLLGPPQGQAESQLKAFHEQWVYPARGLSLHVHEGTRVVFRIYAFPPLSLDAYWESFLSRVSIRREPRRRRGDRKS
jgi:hypothetical protein